MASDIFFIDLYGDVMQCSGTKDKEIMVNLNESSQDELWNSKDDEQVRCKVRKCDRDYRIIITCNEKIYWKPVTWIIKHKFINVFKSKKYSMYENGIARDYRDGKVTKEQLDNCSKYDMY